MLGGLSVSESPIEVLSLVNYTHNSLCPSGFSILRRPISVIFPRGKKHNIIITRCASSDGGSTVLDKEFEFKPSFEEYLKAMESVKSDRSSNNHSHSNNIPRKKKSFKKAVREEEKGDDEEEKLRKGGFHKKRVFVQEDLRMDAFHKKKTFLQEDSRKDGYLDEIGEEKFTRKENKNLKMLSGRRSGSSESKFVDMERAAFRSLDYEDDFIDKPRVTKVDMEERIQKLAKCLNGADIDMPEWKFSHMMRSAQIRFSDHSMLRIVQILGNLGNWRRILQVIEWIQSRERYKSHKIRHIYTAALDALGKARRPVEALNLFCTMQEQMASYPDIVAYRSIAVTLGQAGYMKELFDVIDIMRSHPKKKFKTNFIEKWDPRLEPDIIVYNAVLNACVKRKKFEGAFWVLQQLSQQGKQTSSTTYGLVMEVMLACEKYNLVHDFFKKVQKSYIPNALIYKVLVNTLWREGKTDEAVMAVEEMEKRGIVGNAGLYYDLARCLCSAGRCREALKQVDKICRVANKPLVITYTGLLQACLNSGHIKDGAYIFKHMQKFCSPNLVTYNIMLKALLDKGMFDEAKQLFLTLLENAKFINHEEDYKVRVIPDIYSFNTMLDACVVEKKWEDLEFVYAQMLRYGHPFNAKRHLRLILDACRAGEAGLLEMTWEHLVETKRVPAPQLVAEMFCLKLEQGESAVALSYINKFASAESQVFSRKFWLKFFIENGDRFEEGTLIELIHEATVLLARSEILALRHLIESCKEYLRTSRDLQKIEVANKSQKEAAFVF